MGASGRREAPSKGHTAQSVGTEPIKTRPGWQPAPQRTSPLPKVAAENEDRDGPYSQASVSVSDGGRSRTDPQWVPEVKGGQRSRGPRWLLEVREASGGCSRSEVPVVGAGDQGASGGYQRSGWDGLPREQSGTRNGEETLRMKRDHWDNIEHVVTLRPYTWPYTRHM